MEKSVGELGEFGIIKLIHSLIEQQNVLLSKNVTLGIGDDAAAFRPKAGLETLVTCDSVVEGRHYLARFISPFEVGRRAMALNISDIGAMGGKPTYALVSLGLRPDTPVADIVAIYRGFFEELSPLDACIIGGNVTRTDGPLFVDITLMGEVETDKMMRRSGARPGDSVLVTGYPGQASAGLQLLLKEPSISKRGKENPLIKAYILPSHRALEGQAVAGTGLATAMIDTSDGLLGDLGHICEQSRTGVLLDLNKLPISPHLKEAALRLGLDPIQLALGQSDDYELIITCPQTAVEQIRWAISQVSNVIVTQIGQITEHAHGFRLLWPDGALEEVRPAGWDHFSETRHGPSS